MKFGKANEIPQVEVKCECDMFENMIRKMGVEFCCEWFGHKADSEFTKETIKVLMERSNILESNAAGEVRRNAVTSTGLLAVSDSQPKGE